MCDRIGNRSGLRALGLVVLSAALFGLAAPLHAQQEGETPAALVVKLEGAVQLSLQGAEPSAAAVGTRLQTGDRIIPGSGARAILVNRTGGTQVVTQEVTITAADGTVEEGDLFSKTVGVLARAATTDARGQPNRQGMIRPIPGEPVIVAPRNGILVMTPRPTFEWQAVEGAEGYTIQIRREGGTPVRYQADSNIWTLPSDAPALLLGGSYFWTIAPNGSGRPTREQRFTVIGPEGLTGLAADLDRISELGLEPDGDGLFLSAIVYRDHGLFYEAQATLDALTEGDEPMSDLVYLLKGEVFDALGKLDQAREAFDRADAMASGG